MSHVIDISGSPSNKMHAALGARGGIINGATQVASMLNSTTGDHSGNGNNAGNNAVEIFTGAGGQVKNEYHNTGGGCCDDAGTFPSLNELHQMQQHGGGSFRVTLRDWYITNFCTDAVVQQMVNIQKFGANHVGFWTKYFLFWSFFGDYLFYITVLPAFSWCGSERDGYVMAVMLSLGMYLTDTMKDVFAAPRPPCPPLRRGGHHGHSLEYGLPSTHACNASILAVELALFFTKAYPSLTAWIWLGAFVLLAHICFSRVWLGMHWPGDIWAGLACFVFLWLLEFTFIRDLLYHVHDHYGAYPYVFPLLVGHVLLVFHATPRGTCPCFEDSARFLGVLVGVTIGQWQRERWELTQMIKLQPDQMLAAFFSLAFIGRFVTGILAVAAVKTITGLFLPKTLKHFFNFSSGSIAPKLVRIPPLLFTYKMYCFAVGLLLGKQLRLEIPGVSLIPVDENKHPVISSRNRTARARPANIIPSSSSIDNDNAANIVYDQLVKTAEEVAFGSPTFIAAPNAAGPEAHLQFGAPNTGSAISSAMGQLTTAGAYQHPNRDVPNALVTPNATTMLNVGAGATRELLSSTAVGGSHGNGNAQATATAAANNTIAAGSNNNNGGANLDSAFSGYGGRYWSLRNHTHWWEHELQSKYLNYTSIGWAISLLAPCVINRIWGTDFPSKSH